MHLEGERTIAAPRERVWAALDDTDVLRRCIPGCESLERDDPTAMTAVATVRVGPVKARFRGTLTFEDMRPPESLRIRGQGQGGAAGFAQGEADVALASDGEETVLRYAVDARVGGKLAQIGGRLIDQSARAMAESFFTTLDAEVAGAAAIAAPWLPRFWSGRSGERARVQADRWTVHEPWRGPHRGRPTRRVDGLLNRSRLPRTLSAPSVSQRPGG